MRKEALRKVLWTLVAAAAALAVAWLASASKLARETNLDLAEGDFRHVYVQSRSGEPHKCSVSGRGGATTRRAEPTLVGARWKCRWLQGEGGQEILAATTGKEPSYLFIAADAVHDPAFPYLYQAVRSRDQELLPRVRWVQLFWNRRYRGLALQVRLPDKKYADRHDLGRVEIMATDGDRMWCVTRKLDPACILWNESFIAESLWPQPASSRDLDFLRSLAARRQAPYSPGSVRSSYFLAENANRHLRPFPLPVDLSAVLGEVRGRHYVDRRYADWPVFESSGDLTRGHMPAPPDWWSEAELQSRDAVRASLTHAFKVSCETTGCSTEDLLARLDRSPSLAYLPGGS